MWHEARKQERMIRGMIVDYRRRAERRRDFYEKIKADPTQFLQIHGRPCKIHLDPAVAAVGDSLSVMMPWQGDPTNSIDRFDVRAHLDFIPEVKNPEIPTEELGYEERHCNYERYRILAQNSFLGISEEKFLRQLEIEEQFGVTMEEKEQQKEKLNEKKAIGAAIGYNYDDSTPQGTASAPAVEPKFNNQGALKENVEKEKDDSDDDSDLEIIDVDLSIDVSKVEPAQAHEMNSHGPLYGMAGCDLFSFLTGDADDAEQQKQIMMEEKEKALFSGRKSRRERRAQRDKRLALRVVTVPSYAVGPLPESGCKYSPSGSRSRSQSRTPSPTTGGGIQFITSFGGEDEANVSTGATSTGNTSYADKAKQQPMDKKTYASAVRDTGRTLRRSLSPSPKRTTSAGDSRSNRLDRSRSRSNSRRSISMRSGSRLRCNRSRSRSSKYRRSRSRSQPTKYRISKSSSRSRSREAPRRMSRSRSRYRSYSRSCSSSGSYGYNGRHWSPLRNANQSGGVGGSGLTVPRYYGRRGKSKSSSELSIDSSESSDEQSNHKDKSNFNASGAKASSHSNLNRYSGTTNKSSRQGGGKGSSDKGGLKERLRRKMQAQLSRQLRADKKAEAERMEREHQLQQERDEEMREMAIKIRRKQREMRHQRSHYSYSPGSGSEDSRSSSPRRRRRSSEHDYDHDTERHSRRVDREHDSPPRERRRMPVWQHEEDEMRRNEQLSVWPQRFEDFPPRRRRSCNSDDNGSPMRKLVDY